MPMQKLVIAAGVNTLATPLLNAGGWSESNLIRFRDGYLEKLGGWQRLFDEPVVGIGRTLHSFQDLDTIKYLAIGTSVGLYLYDPGSGLQNITPIEATEDLTAPFATTASDSTVEVTDTAHGATAGDQITVFTQAAIGGIVIYGDYLIQEVIDADTYTIDIGEDAASTVDPGGTVPVFDTTNGDATVTVTLTNHGYEAGDIYPVGVSTTVGGLTLLGYYTVTTVPDADTLTFEAATTAGSDDTASENGGDVQILYRLPVGLSSSAVTSGYGTGAYGSGPYGISSGSPGTYFVPLRYWSLDNFGENLLASPTNGALYEWVPPKEIDNFATVVSAAPAIQTAMFVAMPQAQVISLGAETGAVQDPLLVRWCDNGNYNDWTATIANQAGSYRLSRGSTIVGGLQGPQAGYIWTDLDLWQMIYRGAPLVYDFSIVSTNCGLIAPKASAVMGRDVVWMTQQGFWIYGTVPPSQIPCPIWDTIFANLDTANQDKCIAAANTPLGEITWYYPSVDGGGEIDSYVKLSRITGLWDYGSLVRTGWTDQNLFGTPLGIDANGRIQQHEQGYNNDNEAMTGVLARSGFADLDEGTNYYFVDQVIPDIDWQSTNGQLYLTVYTRMTSGGSEITHGPYTITPDTTYITIRARARQMAFQYEMEGLDMFFRAGATRVRAATSGRVG